MGFPLWFSKGSRKIREPFTYQFIILFVAQYDIFYTYYRIMKRFHCFQTLQPGIFESKIRQITIMLIPAIASNTVYITARLLA